MALARDSRQVAQARDAAVRVLAEVPGADAMSRLAIAKDLIPKVSGGPKAEREALSLRLRALAGLLRDVAILSRSGDERLLANADLKPGLERALRSYTAATLPAAFAAVDRGIRALERNASPKIVADWVLLQI
jgi:hypothetical protein